MGIVAAGLGLAGCLDRAADPVDEPAASGDSNVTSGSPAASSGADRHSADGDDRGSSGAGDSVAAADADRPDKRFGPE